MKILTLLMIFTTYIYALKTSDKLFECTEIFKERKSELLVELERIDEQKQALSALKIATQELLKKKKAKLEAKEKELDEKLATIEKKEKSVEEMLKQNQKILKELKSTKLSKISQTFAKMKPASSANILSDMDSKKAVEILQSLKPKIVGKILTKMDAKKASEITQLLSQ